MLLRPRGCDLRKDCVLLAAPTLASSIIYLDHLHFPASEVLGHCEAIAATNQLAQLKSNIATATRGKRCSTKPGGRSHKGKAWNTVH